MAGIPFLKKRIKQLNYLKMYLRSWFWLFSENISKKYVTELFASVKIEMVVVVAFFSLAGIWGEYSTILSPPALFFFFKVEISSRRLIPLSRPGSVQNGSASWDDCDRVFPDELRVSARFVIVSHTVPGQRHSQPTPTSLGQGTICCNNANTD